MCIVKVPYESGMGHDLLTQLDVYRKELDIYELILPKLKAQLMQSGINADIVADTIHVCHQHKSIVFEDLSLRGFRMAARCDGLDMAHTKILLRQLAVFHATCALLHEKDENIYKNFKHGNHGENGHHIIIPHTLCLKYSILCYSRHDEPKRFSFQNILYNNVGRLDRTGCHMAVV